jgi:hypothetical protein
MTLRHDIAQNYALKSAIQDLLGNQAWLDLKETTSVATWRRYIGKLLDAIEMSIHQSVDVRDEAWTSEVNENLSRGRELAKSAKSIEDLLSGFSATLLRQVFLQVGFLPKRSTVPAVSINRENWRLNLHRSAQYIQTPKQVEAAFWSQQQKRIGFDRQLELHNEHRGSGSKLSFSKWCRERGF